MMTKKKRTTIVIISLFIILILCVVVIIHLAVNGTDSNVGKNDMLDRAALIDDKNSMLIGKETQDNTPLNVKNEKGNVEINEENKIVHSIADDVLPPSNITNFETINNVTPEVIIPNGSAATFGQSNIVGWTCNIGDELVYQFEKYKSETVDEQTMIVGYILDGVMYPGKNFSEMQGEYKQKIEKGGEYFIYVINAASDPLALKAGNVYILN